MTTLKEYLKIDCERRKINLRKYQNIYFGGTIGLNGAVLS
jgi:hypothetical protein